MAQGTTTKSTQIVPEVLKPMMQAELDKKLRFAQ
ncbi:MAG: N4-gp56 family major capsid protein, partial [Staphylococcus epidermidis]|nr:N4-gp56 family major capsid protein [Staphylococcus epidermidis]